ncbi:MAG: DUF1810 domain-containing protein [Paludibacterium sp.]|uniref:DUF1810 domain-containing protein n=1 Tax=Paludibacterium sp. TaxID=1917523 RepID=UPI0025E5F475|nr:DUF1810 domain-containing protein [Paludibacterium sp.]MBV8049485.1 DUF1810 domain-containing protein [Paludibacterium sp.]MBV8646255.1 DUF1810 domain-containing protein [Paludibacterium sp.]
MNDLSRFLDAQRDVYASALAELTRGRKEGHWMWFVFPQLRGLGHSAHADFYGIADLAEASDYLQHPVLGPRLIECTQAVLSLAPMPLSQRFGYPDDLKFVSSMTLFSLAAGAPPVFSLALDQCNRGQRDAATLRLLAGR